MEHRLVVSVVGDDVVVLPQKREGRGVAHPR